MKFNRQVLINLMHESVNERKTYHYTRDIDVKITNPTSFYALLSLITGVSPRRNQYWIRGEVTPRRRNIRLMEEFFDIELLKEDKE